MSNLSEDEDALLTAYRGMYRGMLNRDIDLLDQLLDPAYTLTHMTGYEQPRSEWLQQIASGRMQYHLRPGAQHRDAGHGRRRGSCRTQSRRRHDLGRARHLEPAAHYALRAPQQRVDSP